MYKYLCQLVYIVIWLLTQGIDNNRPYKHLAPRYLFFTPEPNPGMPQPKNHIKLYYSVVKTNLEGCRGRICFQGIISQIGIDMIGTVQTHRYGKV